MGTQKREQNSSAGNAGAGEAGHQGHDRQPTREGVKKVQGGSPDASEAATPGEVAARSKEAMAAQNTRGKTADITHPGPGRMESEKSKGDVHHNQHEREKDLQEKVQDL